MKEKLLSLGLACLIGVGGAFTLTSSASAAENTLTQDDYHVIEENMYDLGIDKDTAEKLLDKIANGEAVEADIATPEDAVDTIVEKEKNYESITYIYSDGSRSRETVEEVDLAKKAGVITPFSISGGSCSSGSGYSTCRNRKVEHKLTTYGYSFYANYEIYSGSYDKVTWAGDWNIWTGGGTYENPSMRIIRGTENYYDDAEARLSGTVTLANSAGSITRSLSLLVGSNSAKDSWNTFY